MRRGRAITAVCLGVPAVLVVSLTLHLLRRDRINTALADAIARNDGNGVASSLSSGADPNYSMIDLQHSIMQRLYDVTHRSAEHVPLYGYSGSALLAASAHLRDLPPDSSSMSADVEGEGPTQKSIEVLSALIHSGANVNVKDFEGTTALMCAAGSGRLDTMQLLLDHGADISAKDNEGYTALMWAASRNKTAAIKLLLSTAGNPSQANLQRSEALRIAEPKHTREAIEVLRGRR